MAKMTLNPGQTYDVVSSGELADSLSRFERNLHATIKEELRGIKPLRVPFTGNLPGNAGFGVNGPQAGYIWSVRRVAVNPATPGTVLVFRSSDGQNPPAGNFIANITTPGSTIFSSASFLLYPTEFLFLSSVATLGAAPGHMEVTEVPAEMIGKLLT